MDAEELKVPFDLIAAELVALSYWKGTDVPLERIPPAEQFETTAASRELDNQNYYRFLEAAVSQDKRS